MMTPRNPLQDLITELCPQGVEFHKLGDVCEIGTGKSNKQDSITSGPYPLFVRSATPLRANVYHFDEEAIILPGEGGVGDIFHYINGKYALHQRAYRICPSQKCLNAKFLYHCMFANFKKYILTKAVGSTVISVRLPMLQNFQIPLPPLEIQNRIVEILDTFTELEKELEKELSARKKQYEHYRNTLLSFESLQELSNKLARGTKVEMCSPGRVG